MPEPRGAAPPDPAELERLIGRFRAASEQLGSCRAFAHRSRTELGDDSYLAPFGDAQQDAEDALLAALRRREAALAEARATIAWYADEANHVAHWDTALGQAGWVDAEIELDRGERARAYLAAHGEAGGDDVR